MRWLTAMLAAALLLACAAPASAARKDPYVDLNVIVELDKPAYLPTDVVRMRVLVMNDGTATATGVVVRPRGDLEFTPSSWEGLEESGPGIELLPGKQKTVVVTAAPNDTGNGMTQSVEVASAEPDRDPANNTRTVTAFVTAEQCDLTLTLYGDADRDSVVDPGEPMAGVFVTLSRSTAPGPVTARTDETGTIHLEGIPGGEYWVQANLPRTWYHDLTEHLKLRPGHNVMTVRATHQDLSKLVATVAFDRDSYAVLDPIRERVTLTNTGTTDLTGLSAHCGGFGIEPGNRLDSSEWGDLAAGAQGVVVRAGETRTWEFDTLVPPRAWDYGSVVLQCDFGIQGAVPGVYAEARAAVPGGRGTVSGRLRNTGGPVPGVTLLLINEVTGVVAGRAVSGADGRFQSPELPADAYELRPLGPWRWSDPTYFVQIFAGTDKGYGDLDLVPGPIQLDPDQPAPTPKKSTVDTPVPRAAARPANQANPANLADTGANVVELSAFGVLLVVTGALALRVRRPRRT
jgi:hypothetical protein